MSSILKVDQLQDSGGNAIITSNGSGTFTPSFNNAGGLVKLEDINVTSSVSAVEINIDYSGYTAFKLIINELNKSGTSSSNIQFRVKRDGQSSFDSGSNTYGNQQVIIDTGTRNNSNNDVNSIAIAPSASGDRYGFSIEATIFGSQQTDTQFRMQGLVVLGQTPSTAGYIFGGTRVSTEKVTDIQITDTVQNIEKCIGSLYGLKA